MDKKQTPHRKTIPIRHRNSETSQVSSSSSAEGTFIPLNTTENTTSQNIQFVNSKFTDDEEEEVITIVDVQSEEKPPLYLLFPDLESDDKEKIEQITSTTQVTQMLVGKKADFSLLKRSKQLNPSQKKLPTLVETATENNSSDETGQVIEKPD